MLVKKLKWTALGLISVLAINACDMEDDTNIDPSGTGGRLKVEMTDAPIDEASVQGVFVTVTEVRVDGKKWEAFQGPKTVNLLELQGGKTVTLTEGDVSMGSFDKLTLVLDYERDANGNAPGCYIQRQDGTKNKLVVSGNARTDIEIKGPKVDIAEGQTQTVVMDFDLRKAIKEQGGASKDYAFVTYGELQSSIRFVKKESTGSITGKLNNYNASTNGKAVAYVYTKGSFKQNTETSGQGESQVRFKNSVTSTKVNSDGSFTAAFIPEGEYELHVVTYRQEGSGQLNLNTFLDLNSETNLNAISVKANSQTNLSLSIKGILGGIL
ncbi:DUF4382 domain-containing protein [Telluribacter sp. SYSU D00476]|uniref:DUF4382 domain-containing protein n=1 Tax=Telluribacter sp. SYSU D00476 TaxID=2811430 RepID=UPI001FF46A27|nr:DUF4382 domain-containing protein [Telluribacter sp. SYSU D00476]